MSTDFAPIRDKSMSAASHNARKATSNLTIGLMKLETVHSLIAFFKATLPGPYICAIHAWSKEVIIPMQAIEFDYNGRDYSTQLVLEDV
jgi:hypothetical protein